MTAIKTTPSKPLKPSKPLNILTLGAILNWFSSFKVYTKPTVARMLALGFAAGLPLLLVLGTLSFWLSEAGINVKTIGYLSWIGLVYAFKWVWSPLVDRLTLPLLKPWLGQRRSWLVLAQAGIIGGLLGMAWVDPKTNLDIMVGCALWVAFWSATQDIALDALRIESADETMQAALSAAYQTGYRLAMIWAGAGVLALANWVQAEAQGSSTLYNVMAWSVAYSVMAGSMLIGLIAVFFTPEPIAQTQVHSQIHSQIHSQVHSQVHFKSKSKSKTKTTSLKSWLTDAIATPFIAFFKRFGWEQACLTLGLIAIYRISDVVMGIMANPFYVMMGYSKLDIASITKIYGVVMTLLGATLGGVLCLRWGVLRLMMVGAVLSALTNCLFAGLVDLMAADYTLKYYALVGVISADNLASGIASAAFIAYMSGLTSQGYSATQYALFSSLMVLLPKFIAGFSGEFVAAYGYAHFFYGTALLGIPVIILIAWIGWYQSKILKP